MNFSQHMRGWVKAIAIVLSLALPVLAASSADARVGGGFSSGSRGYSVIEASNGIEAMEALEEKNGAVDLVVSDVVMPEMDGPTLAKELRSRNPNLKIIFVSGYAEDAFEKNLPDDVKFNFLPKPFTLKQLVATVKETMAA